MLSRIIIPLSNLSFHIPHEISELNGKSFLLSGGTPISSNSDMNNYTEIGNYYANSEIAQSLKNVPFNHSFTMKIDYGNGTGYICQTYREIDTGRIAIRYNSQRVASADQWQPYVYFSDDETIRSDMINDWLTGSSFDECCQKYPDFAPNTSIALKNLDDNIESYESGVHQISGGGPYFHALLFKYTSKYYSGILMCYLRTQIVFFRKYETAYSIKIY